MNTIPSSVFLGPLFLAAFFVLSIVAVAGCKILILLCVRERKKIPAQKKRTPKPPTHDPVRSIEINPEEVDRIYVKKVS